MTDNDYADDIPHFLEELYQTRNETYNCTFKVEDQLFRCHKEIIILASPALRVMLDGQFSEARNLPDNPIALPYVTAAAFERILEYIYCFKGPQKVDENVYNMLNFANMWQIDDLEKICDTVLYHYGPDDYTPRDINLLNEPKKKHSMVISCRSDISSSYNVQHFMERALDGENFDCTIKAGEKVFKCHKFLLSLASPKFKEQFADKTKTEIVLQHKCKNPQCCSAVSHIVRYIYFNKRCFGKQLTCVLEAKSMAQKYEIRSLEQVFGRFLECYTENDDYLEIYSNYKEAGDSKRTQFWMKRIQETCNEIFKLWSHLNYPPEYVMRDILEQDYINISSEFALIRAVWEWGRYHPEEAKQLMRLIRFSAMTPEQVQKCLAHSGFSDADVAKIEESVAKQDPQCLPEGFCRKRARRHKFCVEHQLYWPLEALDDKWTEAKSEMCFSVSSDVYLLGVFLSCINLNSKSYNKESRHYELSLLALSSGEHLGGVHLCCRYRDIIDKHNHNWCLRLDMPVLLTAEAKYKLLLVQHTKGLEVNEVELAVSINGSTCFHPAANITFLSNQKKTGEIYGLMIGEV